MTRLTTIILILFNLNVIGQDHLTELAQPIVAEGKRLYRSEMLSWFGTDLFLETYKDRANMGGYFSYADNDVVKCILMSNASQAFRSGRSVVGNCRHLASHIRVITGAINLFFVAISLLYFVLKEYV